MTLQNSHQVRFLHDHQLFAVGLDLGAGPFAEQHPIADLHIQWVHLAILRARARPDAVTSPSMDFSFAVSGMMMPPAVLASWSTLRTRTRSCSGRNFMGISSE